MSKVAWALFSESLNWTEEQEAWMSRHISRQLCWHLKAYWDRFEAKWIYLASFVQNNWFRIFWPKRMGNSLARLAMLIHFWTVSVDWYTLPSIRESRGVRSNVFERFEFKWFNFKWFETRNSRSSRISIPLSDILSDTLKQVFWSNVRVCFKLFLEIALYKRIQKL